MRTLLFYFSVLSVQMRYYNQSAEHGKVAEMKDQVDELKEIMVKNIGNLLHLFLFCACFCKRTVIFLQ